MHLKLLLYTAGFCTLAAASMANVLVQNVSENDQGIYSLFNQQGVLLSPEVGNTVRLGTFTEGFNIGEAWSSGDIYALESNFLQFGHNGSLLPIDEVHGLIQELFTSDNAAFSAKPIVLWVSDTADFLNPLGQHLIFRFNTNFDMGPSSEQTVSLRPGTGDLLVGGFGFYSHDYGLPDGALPGFNLEAVVPEPATYALVIGAALAGLVALRRRSGR